MQGVSVAGYHPATLPAVIPRSVWALMVWCRYYGASLSLDRVKTPALRHPMLLVDMT